MSNSDELSVISQFVELLDALHISYAIGGSVASSVYGYVRFTQDADISVVPFDGKIHDFCARLTDRFYFSEDAIREAHRINGSFNVIHLETAFKIDVFVRYDKPFDRQMFARRRKLLLDESFPKEFELVSPEDIVLLKLQWYKDGGCVSEKQWNDIQGVLKTQSGGVDLVYLRQWAQTLSVGELLEHALRQAK
ncbi:MAG: hypothetical protein LLF76_07000 [Planctomycetaceae bacterium]|nr:hypothetical protein [Planctomycetaceae bacterium]